jgi:hypothetical protein
VVRLLVGLICLVVLAFLLAEFFIVFLLPRRVKRDPAIARAILRTLWVPWRAAAGRLPIRAADTMLGVFGPFGLVAILGLLSAGVIMCYTGLYWANSAHLSSSHPAAFGDYLYFSAGAFVSATTPATPSGGFGRLVQIAEAANGLGFLAIAIGYLPALFQAFSRREIDVARLDPRAGSPPSAGMLLERSGQRGGWPELDEYLREWETWIAELMDTHLGYPILAWFRSQHVSQNWVAALTTITDVCAYAIAFGPEEATYAAEITFRIGRHALTDIAYVLSTRRVERDPEPRSRNRLTAEGLAELRSRLEGSGLHSSGDEEAEKRLGELRSEYEPYAIAISRHLALNLPDWLPSDEVRKNWGAPPQSQRRNPLLP